MKLFIPEKFRTRIIHTLMVTGTGAQAYLLPSAGVNAITIRCVAKMANAADLVPTLKSSDDATGTNAAAWADDVPIYVDGVAQTAAKAHTIGAATGNFIVDFCIDPAKVPNGKFVGISFANSNDANLLEVTMIEETMYSNTAT